MPNQRILRLALPLCILVLLVLVTVSLVIGDMPLTLTQVWQGLWRQDELASTVVWQMRMPRLLCALLVGASLSSGGLVMQAYFRNSLASPGLLGVSSGGAAGAVIAIALGWSTLSIWTLPLAAIVGSTGALVAVIGLARSGASTERLLLAGVALNALLGAVTSYVLSMHTSIYERNSQILFWLLGGLEDRGWEHVLMASPIVIAAALLWPLGRQMDLLSLGASEAQSLGVDVTRLRRSLLVLAAVLTAIATAVAGTVGFVGLVVPHALRLLLGPEHRRLVPVSIVGGAAFVLGCDLICRSMGGVKLGIITSLVGAPFFLWLLRRQA